MKTRILTKLGRFHPYCLVFGKTALIVMAGYGVGPDTGARILKNRLEDDDDYLIKQIIIAEKTYTLTRGFWKD